MYSDLVKKLRTMCPEDYNNLMDFAYGAGQAMAEAADAIEELSREYGSIAVSLNESVELVRKLQSPRWIPVTERLPDETGNYLTAFGDRTAMAVNEFMHPRDWLTEEGREAHPNGKWYWGGVTHWMELPEPPKEEKQ